jgi:hypothetical protein
MFVSNFMNTKLFGFGDSNFTVWFYWSAVICFAVGWYIEKALDGKQAVK